VVEAFKRWEIVMHFFWKSRPVEVRDVRALSIDFLPLFREAPVVIVDSNVLEKQPVIALFARVEVGLELDRGNLDSLAARVSV